MNKKDIYQYCKNNLEAFDNRIFKNAYYAHNYIPKTPYQKLEDCKKEIVEYEKYLTLVKSLESESSLNKGLIEILMKYLKNPSSGYFPPNSSLEFFLSYSSDIAKNIAKYEEVVNFFKKEI